MADTRSRRRFVLTTAAAVAVAVSLSACTEVVNGAAMAGDRGPCTHVNAPMLDIPASSASEPRMRIPEPAGWQRDTEFEDTDPGIRLALSDFDANTGESPVIAIMVEEVPPGDAADIFDGFEDGLVEGLGQQGFPPDVTRTASTLCGLPSATFGFEVTESSLPVSTLAVVAESGGQTYLIAVIGGDDVGTPAQQRDAESILTGLEVLPVEAGNQT